jgi:serine/threonine-protein kinase
VRGAEALAVAHAWRVPDPPSRLTSDPVPPELDRLVLRALAKNPDDRYSSAREFEQELARVEDALRRPAGWLETSVFDPEKLAAITGAKSMAPPIVPAGAPVHVGARAGEATRADAAPEPSLADTQPSPGAPPSHRPEALPRAQGESKPALGEPPVEPSESARASERPRITILAVLLLALSALVVVLAGVLLSR